MFFYYIVPITNIVSKIFFTRNKNKENLYKKKLKKVSLFLITFFETAYNK